MELATGMRIHNFTIESVEELPEIDGKAYLMRHDTCGAKLLYMQNDDTNKAFSIAFRTPPKNDTGVFHILEHSVLCGSRKFNVKEPFVNLLKTSMQTFLNAMTFADKTMYPVASTNEQDLINLMDVYMDAVLHPNIYSKPQIFQQEGWHYEPAEGEDGATKFIHNGVVFNEMKGALSDPPSVLFDALQAALFPDTTYAFESGGTPAAIPTLTYEEFLAEHTAHYRLDNSYITLYGTMDIDRVLGFLDDEYLTPCGPGSATGPFPRELTLQEPVSNLNQSIQMQTTPDNACASLGYCLGTVRDRERVIAADILLDVLAGSNEAPLKRAILDANLASDIHSSVIDGMLQPYAALELRGLNPGAFERFKPLVDETLASIADKGIDPELIEASLAHAEFGLRERNFGYPDGVVLSMSALSGWLYDDSLATAYVKFQDAFDDLRSKIGTGYFENLVRELFLQNNHIASVELIPTGDPDATNPVFDEPAIDPSLDKETIEQNLAVLRAAQEAPDAPEDIAALPHLGLQDLAEAPAPNEWHLDTTRRFPCVVSDVSTHGIAYVNRYYDVANLSFDEIPYMSILCSVLGKLDTAKHTAAELDVAMQGKLGQLTFTDFIMTQDDDISKCCVRLAVYGSALESKISDLASLSHEIMTQTDFSDTERIRTRLEQQRVTLEQAFLNAGHIAALRRAISYYKPAALVLEQFGGVDFYRFLKDLLANFDERALDLSAKLSSIAARVFVDENCFMGFGGSDEAYTKLWDELPAMQAPRDTQEARMVIPQPTDKHEAFGMPGNVTYSALSYDRRLIDKSADAPTAGAWKVCSRIVGLDYLWNEVRVKGGAYGTGMKSTLPGETDFYSYRDPHVTQTFERFTATPDWIEAFCPSDDELEGYIVSSVAEIDSPQKPKSIVRKNTGTYLLGRPKDFEQTLRNELLSTTLDDLRATAPILRDMLKNAHTSCFGSADVIASEQTDFKFVQLFDED